MPVIAIVGAGPGLGIEIARAFGKMGFAVAMVARNAAKLDALAAELHAEGIKAAGFTGDISKPDTITEAFARIKEQFGTVDVLEFSPVDQTLNAVGVLDVDPAALQPQVEFYINGAIHAVRQVVTEMIAAESGTILITTGGGSITPVLALANINIAAAGLRNWTLNLHQELKPQNIYVAHVAISAWIGAEHPGAAPDVIAGAYRELYETRIEPELHYIALND
ncbi:MAG TPA: SDR family NAD(P)-dependent oxidoreductase [Kribbella sp.]|uniref:SDR family NAD(P)-dependent oxidoreductase n=1 Tax=Kribbella sp. TaxID=1871183 RepID=UPI002D788BAA|nr:SDR family NAD(P)-dependent oxidoreductase [Kribbella sp.]HET6299445.1 SDR family NAD(P)-dependent oxidoreductase [Kribbella sp.]